MKDLKYLLAYTVPITGFCSVYFGGIMSIFTVVYAFMFIPMIELYAVGNTDNHEDEIEPSRLSNRFFDVLLYLNVPILFTLVYFLLINVTSRPLSILEIIGMTVSVGMVLGSNGINVAHELGHRNNTFDKFMAQLLLLPNLYMHFTSEHNFGHHKNIATDADPASSRLNENIYSFWIRSVVGCYTGAWKIEAQRLNKDKKAFFSIHNYMIVNTLIQIIYLGSCVFFFGKLGIVVAIVAAIVGFLMLETVNYIEHYGLRRKQLENGRYEQVMPHHSWNSDHEIGRIILYELTRHSDHHYQAARKYQILRHHDQTPQLPYGYPGCMVLALVPPLWFRKMNPIVAGLAA